MNAFWITTLALASMACANAQDIPPLTPLRGDAASLKDTMKFIQDKLPGKVNFMVYGHDNVAGSDVPAVRRSYELSNVSADAGRCHIGFHWRFDTGDKMHIEDRDDEIFLKQIQEITVTSSDQAIQQANAKVGHPEISARTEPAVFLLGVRTDGRTIGFKFYDEALADRVSKALQHAVESCGGGSQEPF